MAYGGYSYIDLDYTPEKSDVITLLWIKGKGKLEKLAESINSESSIGTWTSLSTMKPRVWDTLKGVIYDIKKTTKNSGFVKIAYPEENFDKDNIMQLLASIRGNIYGIKEVDELKILDWTMPLKYQRRFKGPKLGIKGIRKIVGTLKSKRPHVGTIVKPKIGLTPSEFREVALAAFSGGCDLVKDDENLVDQKFCPWEERVSKVVDAVDGLGEPKIYLPNITDFIPRMMERVDFLEEIGWKMCMLDVYLLGVPATKYMIDELHKRGFLVHAHRAGHGAETRGKRGVSFAFWTKIMRLLGVDQIHTGTGVGKMEGSALIVRKFGKLCREYKIENAEPLFLDFKWSRHLKPVMPVASGGLHPGMVEAVCAVYGTTDVTIQAGGGVHGHVAGTFAGARALRFAAEKTVSKKPLEPNPSYTEAINQWGYVKPESVKKLLAQWEKDRSKVKKLIYKKGYGVLERIEESGKMPKWKKSKRSRKK